LVACASARSLKLADAHATKEYKNYKGKLTVYAREMHIRYFVQGDVRKFGDNIKITSRLLDIESGEYLWQDSLKGTMEDIFDIQEKVARKIVEGLQVILTQEENQKLDTKRTDNPEAYECYLKAVEYYLRYNRIDLERALMLLQEAVRLDPAFAGAYIDIANITLLYYRWYSRDAGSLESARENIATAEKLLGQTASIYRVRSVLARTLGNYAEAIELADRATTLDPEYALGFDALGFAYKSAGDPKKAAEALEKYTLLRISDRSAHFALLSALNELGDASLLEAAAKRALPLYQRHIHLNPDDINSQVHYANILYWAGNREQSLNVARELSSLTNLDGAAVYNLACLLVKGGSNKDALLTLARSIERGFLDIETFRRDPDLASLRGTPEFEELMKKLEEKIAKENNMAAEHI
jgi:adenylate cyclase